MDAAGDATCAQTALRPQAGWRAAHRREIPRQARWTLWTSVLVHAAVLGGAGLFGAYSALPAPVARAPQELAILPESPNEPEDLERLREELDVPLAPPEPDFLVPPAPAPDPRLVDPVPEPLEEPPLLESPQAPGLTSPRLEDARRRVRPEAAAAAAPPPPAPAEPPPAPPAPRRSLPRAAPSPASAPDLPMSAALAALPRGLVAHLVLTVEESGRVSDVSIEGGSGHPAFDRAVEGWVLARWRFAPLGLRFRTRVPFHGPR